MLKKILPIAFTFILIFGLITTACSKKPRDFKQEYKPIYNYYILANSFKKEVETKFHSVLTKKQNEIIYIDQTMQQNENLNFFTQSNLQEISLHKQNQNVSSKYEILSQRQKQALSNDLNKIISKSKLEETIVELVKPEFDFYASILEFGNENQKWFEGISYDFENTDFSYLNFDKKNQKYIANVNLDLVFAYQYTDINKNVIKNKYQQNIVITISNKDDIIEDLKFTTSELRENLIKDKFEWAWFDAYDLRINDYSRLLNLSNSDFENLFKFNKFEKSLLNYISERTNSSNISSQSYNYNFAFKDENRFKSFKSINKINNFNERQNKYGSNELIFDDAVSTSNANNMNLFKTIFSELITDDQIVLENKFVKGNQDIHDYLNKEYKKWVNDFQTKFKQELDIDSDSIVSYGEITLNNFFLYFSEFNYYHPISPISYYVAISANNINDSYLNSEKEIAKTKIILSVQDPIFKTIYQNTMNALEVFQETYGTRKTTWKSLSDNQHLISLKGLNILQFKVGNTIEKSISDVNAQLSLLNNNLTYFAKLERQKFLNKTNTSSFHFQFNNSEEIKNIPIIKVTNNQLIFKKFKEAPSNLSIDFNLSFLNLSFVIKSEKFYKSEITLIESN
ncbi:hypothetical protein MENTO_v1c05040 [Mesoplasma entomophilum]|uniref:Lipoprotein n=1 Tax=Mesoplasma entomophilum TaxID=2149 RepID=A0A3S5Y0B8_9MOLU|nr:hypothetical protein [Mesoplasma entomophilum]ATQ35639.1 hypothetical protein CS528_02605 [Mesoplasma entomophilum]ATZ19608.1 hypothetical protein MENTO_v1c05040 [Mesoplasma entomophilum]